MLKCRQVRETDGVNQKDPALLSRACRGYGLHRFRAGAFIAGDPPSAILTASVAMKDKKKKIYHKTFFFTRLRLFQPQPTTMETSTRVFVSGLPPTCSNDQLRNHFATRFQVTDAHVLPKRRMGFVGFKDHEAAQSAVKYFNKTFLKMSKISVDIARPVCDASPRLRSQSSCLVFFLFCFHPR